MKIGVTIKDEKTGGCIPPVWTSSIPELVRQLTMVLRQKDNLMAQFPADYSVWRVGNWNEETGNFDPLFEKEFLFNMTNIIDQQAGKAEKNA